MIYALITLLIVINALWLGLVLFALPGNWLMVVSTVLFAWWQWDAGVFSKYTLIFITLLAVVGEIFEFMGGYSGARRGGASFFSSLSAIAGAIFGAILGTFLLPVPILGTMAGACLGAAGLSMAAELIVGKKSLPAARAGVGAGVGQFVGIMSKFTVGCLIWLIVAIAALWP